MSNTNIEDNQSELAGKVMLVTDGGSGISRATVLAFAEMEAVPRRPHKHSVAGLPIADIPEFKT